MSTSEQTTTTPEARPTSQRFNPVLHDLGCFVDHCTDLVGGNTAKPERLLKDVVAMAVIELNRLHEHVEKLDDGTDGYILRGIITRLEVALELDGYEPPEVSK